MGVDGHSPGAVRSDAREAVRLARRAFMTGERIDARRIAAQLGVDRTTLFRWVGNRDQLLVAVLRSLADPTLRDAAAGAPGSGPERIGRVLRDFSQALSTPRTTARSCSATPNARCG